MPYRKPAEHPSDAVLGFHFESAIKSLVRRFRNHPYAFYTESDMHCYLYHRLYDGGLANALYETAEGHPTVLLHKEFPTTARYERVNGLLTEANQGRRRGAFDICLWNPESVASRKHREQQVLFAAELALNECGRTSLHTINDATKLTGVQNDIRYRYLLFFVRDSADFVRNREQIESRLRQASERLRVAYVTVTGDAKPKPHYWGNWGAFDGTSQSSSS